MEASKRVERNNALNIAMVIALTNSSLWEIMALLRYLYKLKAVHANVHLSIKITCKMTSVSLIQIYANVRGTAYDHLILT